MTEVEERGDEIPRSGNRSNTASLKPHVEPKAKSREGSESGPRAVLKERGTRNIFPNNPLNNQKS